MCKNWKFGWSCRKYTRHFTRQWLGLLWQREIFPTTPTFSRSRAKFSNPGNRLPLSRVKKTISVNRITGRVDHFGTILTAFDSVFIVFFSKCQVGPCRITGRVTFVTALWLHVAFVHRLHYFGKKRVTSTEDSKYNDIPRMPYNDSYSTRGLWATSPLSTRFVHSLVNDGWTVSTPLNYLDKHRTRCPKLSIRSTTTTKNAMLIPFNSL